MSKPLVIAAAVVVSVLAPAIARAQCTLFSVDAKCATTKKRVSGVTFGGPSQPAGVAPIAKKKPDQKPAAVLVPHTPNSAAIDCRMVHQAAPGAEAMSRVIAPHPGIEHSMRTAVVPGCAK